MGWNRNAGSRRSAQSINNFPSRMRYPRVAKLKQAHYRDWAKAAAPDAALAFTVNYSSHFYFHDITS
jgi:hypothetical protein